METITNINQLNPDKIYSYADYLLWEFKDRVELFKGRFFKMRPAPNLNHQKVSSKLHTYLGIYFMEQSCSLFSAPFDVRLLNKKKSEENAAIYTVVQPDLCVICDESKLDKRGCIGSPDLVVEILSPGNSKKEMDIKFDLYEEAGVKEYWMVHPLEKTVQVYVLQQDKFIGLKPFIEDQILTSTIFPELEIELKKVFK